MDSTPLNKSETDPHTTITSRDSANWANPVDRLQVSKAPDGARNLNVSGRKLTGPLNGFGQMWEKRYQVRLSGARISPVELIQTWKANFARFWPQNASFYLPTEGLSPGQIALIDADGPANTPLMSTGVMVLYADEESFTFMTPEGHPFAGWVTFSARREAGVTVAEARVLIRANDPLYELGFRLGFLHREEDQVWHHTLTALADHFGVQATVIQQVTLVDPSVQWPQAKNIWKNAGFHAIKNLLLTPFRFVLQLLAR